MMAARIGIALARTERVAEIDCSATPTELRPFFGNAVSSNIARASGELPIREKEKPQNQKSAEAVLAAFP